ncbi:phosphotransferase [Maribius pontilimi]|uniref:Phosphotransferase n=1 Tax=Palleronia pontilimi TaxID=1964209 RepID=A0A934IC12_9RHOB|nr:phosphotransferase [Palleronia pontilimi]MBJ3761692.1 phosphotransferase [Palleronia pontilimi]
MNGGWLSDVLSAADSAPALERALSDALGAPVRLGDLIAVRRGAELFAANVQGQDAVVKRFLGPDGPATVTRAAREYDRLHPAMGQGPHRVVACLLSAPGQSCLILQHAPGRPVSSALEEAQSDQARAAVLDRCGRWLSAYVGPTRSTDRFGPGFWIDRTRKMQGASELTDEDLRLTGALLDAMATRAPDLRDAPVTRGAIHGDFKPSNLHLDADGAIWGFDIQATTRMPLARDVARFVSSWRRDPGIAVDPFPWPAVDALAREVLEPGEIASILRFFLAEQFAARLCAVTADGAESARLRAAVAAFLGAV